MPSSSKKFGLSFTGFNEIINKLNELDANLDEIASEALIESKKYVTNNLEQAMAKHNKSGNTLKSLDKSYEVKDDGLKSSINVGFDINNGGLPSIFLMYGTPAHMVSNQFGPSEKKISGTQKDRELFGALYSSTTTNKVRDIQLEVFQNALRKAELK